MPTHSLKRDVLAAFLVKLALVVAAAFFLFGPGQRPKIDADGVAARLIGSPALNSQP